ncbi:hypothetical protein X963_5681 [Burkholderia pseudomallei MSHR7498]|uniref:hypothetical protein n=1 Tax=Burkholderia glumae TaxID=337 RepID=UPI000531DE83|nr:hypothetical protein [Burkholderia glumae]KGS91875.1 hypothetical protein X963_5681 [Burkholderia pseudomallei MSHR7498]
MKQFVALARTDGVIFHSATYAIFLQTPYYSSRKWIRVEVVVLGRRQLSMCCALR